MKAYKGFNQNLTCRGFQYKEGETYETGRASVCECGFHACENPIDCLGYYGPGSSVYHEVDVDGEIDRAHDDTKIAATKIKIGARLSIAGLVKAAFDFIRSKCTNENNAEPGRAASAGAYGAASAGESGAAVSRGTASVGKDGITCVRGNGARVKGGIGAILVVAEEYPTGYEVKCWKAFVIDGEKYKADTWYVLRDGEIVEVEDNQ